MIMKQAIVLILLSMMTTMVSANRTITVCVSNPMNIARADVPIIIQLAPYGEVRSALVTLNGQEMPCQLDDLDKDDTFDELCFLVNLNKKEKQQYKCYCLFHNQHFSSLVHANFTQINENEGNHALFFIFFRLKFGFYNIF